jgi:FeS assembly SUF system protein
MAGIIENLRHVYDPEIPTNVYELGLIYEIRVHDGGDVHIAMTLTSPNCPVAGELPVWVREAAEKANGVGEGHVHVNLTWDPPWNPTMMSDTAKLQLNMY